MTIAPPTADGRASADELRPGALVGRYVIVSVVGRGGMGVVYAAYDAQLDRKLAIKVLRPDLVAGVDRAEIEARLLREAQAMARLTHPNVVAVHDVGTFEHQVFLAMDYVDGTTLKDWLKAKPRSFRERLEKLILAGRGLAAAHAAGLVHRDFKPDNIMVGNDGRVLVTDFGLARAEAEKGPDVPLLRRDPVPGTVERDPQSSSSLSSPMTETGSVLGTVGYMAPEQAYGEAVNAATDQFSYAATAYAILFGERPFAGNTVYEYLTSIETKPPRARATAGVPAWITRVLLRGLSVDPAKRYPSLDALLEALADDPAVRWRRRGLAMGALLVAVFGVVAGLLLVRQRDGACAPNPNDLRGVWSAALADSVHHAFEATKVIGAADKADRVTARIDEYVARWAEMRSEVCRATRVRKEQPEEVYQLRMDCLERHRAELRSVSSILANADDEVVKAGIDIAYKLPKVEWCADVTTLRASAGLPDDPGKRTKVKELRDQMAQVNALVLVGKTADAAPIARAVVESARAIDYRPTLAEALYNQARVRSGLGEFAEAAPTFREAIDLAISVGTEAIVARAAGAEAAVVGTKLRRAEEAHIWLEIAHAALYHLGASGDDERSLDLLDTEASIASEVERRSDLAVPLSLRAIDGYRRLLGVHPSTADALYNLGVSYDLAGDFAHARPLLEESLSMTKALTGSESLDTGISEYGVGFCLVEQGSLDAGDIMLKEAIRVLEHNAASFWVTATLAEVSHEHLLRRDFEGTVAVGRRALAMIDASNVPTLVPDVAVRLGEALNLLGRPSEALPLCRRALAQQEGEKEIAVEKTFANDSLRCEADALLTLGRAAEALPLLERSLTLKQRMYSGDYARAEYALAKTLTALHKDGPRARSLAESAREELARYPHLRPELERVDAFLNEHKADR